MEQNISIYDNQKENLEKTLYTLLSEFKKENLKVKETTNFNLFKSISGRIKIEDSMREKLHRKGLMETTENALLTIKDSVGIRIVCDFIEDIQEIVSYLKTRGYIEVVEEDDYVSQAKENGYRSHHLVVKYRLSKKHKNVDGSNWFFVEIQIRTVAMDSWASLEHKLQYKQDTVTSKAIKKELKRCSDELYSSDLKMQTIKNLIIEEKMKNENTFSRG